MAGVMDGVRVLEVAQFTFVPAAGAVLADWGADVIKIEHPVRGDTQRGFLNMGGVTLDPQRHTLFEHPNRGKRSVGIDFTKVEGQEMLYELAKNCDVFLTNYLPQHRQKYKFDVEHIRAANPDIIYARGSAWGDKGPEREKGGFDGTAFWSRSGIADCMTPEALEGPLSQGLQAFGDSIGGMFIAGGISAALYHRLKTGETKELDVSLLSTATWAAGANMAQALETGVISRNSMPTSGGSARNPFMGNFRTSDGRYLNFCMVSPTGLIEDTFQHIGRPDAAKDPRFQDVLSLIKNAEPASAILVEAIGEKSFDYWREQLRTMKGQWAPILNLLELAEEEQVKENDHILEVEAADGSDKPLKLSRSPVEWDHQPITATRSPQPSEHTEMVLMEMGVEWDKIEEMKAKGAIA